MIVYTLIIRRFHHAHPHIPFPQTTPQPPYSPVIFSLFYLDQRYSMEYAHTSMYVQHTDTCKSYTCNTYFISLLLSFYIFLQAKLKCVNQY